MSTETVSDARSAGDLLSPLAPGLWMAEMPLKRFGVDIGRRMSVVALARGGVLVHSPAPLDDRLRVELDRLGEVRHVVAPSKYHGHLFMEQYQAAYPEARFYGPPGLARRRRDVRFAAELGDEPGECWRDDLDQARIWGQLFNEVEFFHRRSRTLIVGDCFFALGPQASRLFWLWTGSRRGKRTETAGGGAACRQPVPWRVAVRDREALRRSLERILGWDFDRVVVGHGEIVEAGGRASLRDAYRLLLGDEAATGVRGG